MGKKGLNNTKMLSVSAIDSFISAADAASPSSSSPSSSSSSSCVVDCHNNNVSDLVHNQRVDNEEEEEKPSKPPKRVRRKSINDMSNDTCHPNIATPPPPTNKRSSIYRGVTRHRWTGRFEAHLWDKSSWNTLQNKKGRQGAYDSEVDAARTYDLAALKYWGPETTLNFSIENYTKELDEMQSATKEEYLASLRRRSSGFSRGVSKYRGVARHHHNGRWEARIGRVFGNKYLYLGTFGSQEEAAAAYDLAAIEYRGANAVTNFDISKYIGRVKNFLPKGRKQTQNPDQKKATQPRRPNVKVQVKQREESQEDLEEVQQIKQQKDDEQQGLKVHQTKQQKEEQPDDEEVKLQDLQQVHQEEPTEMQSQFSESKLISSTDHSSILVMDGAQDDRENPWSFCLDTGGYDPLLVPDIPLEEDGKLLDLFDQTGFEDNIDLIFEGEGNLIGVDATYFDGIYESGCHSNDLEKNTKVSPNMESLVCCSSPSSSSSRTSLVSC